MSKPIYFTDAAAKAAYATTPEARAIEAAFRDAGAKPSATAGEYNATLLEALKSFTDSNLEMYCRFRLPGAGTIKNARSLDLTKEPPRVARPAPTTTEKAPSRQKPKNKADKPKEPKTKGDETWRFGSFDSERQAKRIAVFLRRRRSPINIEQAAQLEKLAKEVKNDSEGRERRKPSSWMLDLIGESQLPPAAIEWLLGFGYGLGVSKFALKNAQDKNATKSAKDKQESDAELLEAAQIACAYAILKHRYIYLPDTGEAYRVEDRTAISEASAVGDMQAWFGADVGEHVIRRALRAQCPKANGKVRLPGRDVRFLHDGRWVVNEWTPPPWPEVNATDADVKVYTDHVRWIMGDEAELFFNWMAAHVHPQHWHKHQRWGWILISDHQQTGREATLKIFSRAIGIENYTNGMLAELDKGPELAAYLNRGSFIVFSEGHVGFHQMERMKEVMGSESALMRVMNRNAQQKDHGATFVILSQYDCAKLGKDNLRFMVRHSTEPRKDFNADGTKKNPGEEGADYYDRLKAWEADNGPAKLLSWLRRRDLSKHNFETRPYATAAELELIDSALSPVITDIKELVVARKGPFASELIEVRLARNEIEAGVELPGGHRLQKEVKNHEICDALKAAGATSLNQVRVRSVVTTFAKGGKKEEVSDRDRVSLWALANADKWKALKDDNAPAIRGWGLQCASYDLAKAKAEEWAKKQAEPAPEAEDGQTNVLAFSPPEPEPTPEPTKRPWKPRF